MLESSRKMHVFVERKKASDAENSRFPRRQALLVAAGVSTPKATAKCVRGSFGKTDVFLYAKLLS
jgi:hypothetical protein